MAWVRSTEDDLSPEVKEEIRKAIMDTPYEFQWVRKKLKKLKEVPMDIIELHAAYDAARGFNSAATKKINAAEAEIKRLTALVNKD